MQWNQKERDLLKDLKGQEQLCVDKYMRHAENACDPQLKKLFSDLAQQEARHLQTITQMESGTVPQMQSGGQQAARVARREAQASHTAVHLQMDGQRGEFSPHLGGERTGILRRKNRLRDVRVRKLARARGRRVAKHQHKSFGRKRAHGKRFVGGGDGKGITACRQKVQNGEINAVSVSICLDHGDHTRAARLLTQKRKILHQRGGKAWRYAAYSRGYGCGYARRAQRDSA